MVGIAATPGIPARVFSSLQNKLLPTKAGMLITNPAAKDKMVFAHGVQSHCGLSLDNSEIKYQANPTRTTQNNKLITTSWEQAGRYTSRFANIFVLGLLHWSK